MAEKVSINRDELHLSVLPLFYEEEGTVFVLTTQAFGTSFRASVHLDREELERYRALLGRALAQRPDELPDGCTCTVDIYGGRVRDLDCPVHAELEALEPVAPGEETA